MTHQHPLITPTQERLWFLEQLALGSPLLNTAVAFRLSGPLELRALARCLAEVVRGQPILRTAFLVVDGQLRQTVQPCGADCALIDLGGLPALARADQSARLLRAVARQPFDLARAPLLRTLLLRLDSMTHVLLVAAQRMIADEESLNLVARELGQRYAEVADQPAPLPEPTASYADFARRQRAWLTSAAFESQLAYWRRSLADAPPILALPIDRPRPAVQAIASGSVPFTLPAALSAALQALSERAGVSLFVTLLSAFQMLLYRITAQTDVIIGTPAANRADANVQRMVGPLADSLPLRANLANTPSFHELITRVQQLWEVGQAHSNVPLASIVAALPLARSLSYAPLFQVTFELRAALRPWSVGALTLQPLDASIGASEFDLSLCMALEQDITSDYLAGVFEYNIALFDPTTIQRLVGHWLGLLASVVAYPDSCLADFAILTAAERQQLLYEWNDTASGVRGQGSAVSSDPSDFWLLNAESCCLHQLFEAQTARTPDAVAIVCGEQQVSYRELNARANQLAHHLQSLGVGPELPVALCVERSPVLVVALLGVLKAGAAYVPLDPAYPPERIAFILEDSQARVLLIHTSIGESGRGTIYRALTKDAGEQGTIYRAPTQDAGEQGTIYRAPTQDAGDKETAQLHVSLSPDLLVSRAVLDLSDDWPQIAQASASTPTSLAHADNLAYIIYTSGSSGRPKGVAITHRNAAALLSWTARVFPPAELAGVLAATSLCFDVSVNEIFLTLVRGGTIVLAANVLDLPNLPWRATLTLISGVPTALTELLRLGDLPESTRTVNLGGEPLTRALAQQLYQQRGVRRVYNLYGPSETTTYATFALVERDDARAPAIGRPIANTQVYILDAAMQLVPLGVVGELYIGGAGVTRGYHYRPDMTAERFVPNPWGSGVRDQGSGVTDDPSTRRQGDNETRSAAEDVLQSAICNLQSAIGARLYKTGDLVRYRADGQLEFLGRRDQQIKLRGFRIELGEIAAVLGQHPAVQECVVVLRVAAASEQVLVAYVVTTKDERRKTKDTERDSSTAHRRSSLVSELRTFLSQRLPDYMLPASFVLLDTLPRLPNGKIDQRALPRPEHARSPDARPFAAPHGPLEAGLAAIWSDVLGREIGRHDNFFELGGHSLLATQVISRIQQRFRVQLPLRTLFETPTLAGLAHLIALAAPIELMPPITPVARDGALPLSYAQLRLWLLDQLTPGSPAYNVPLLFELRGALDLPALQHSLDEVIRRHEALRTTFSANEPFQVIAPAASLAWLIEDLRSLHELDRRQRASEHIAQAARQPFVLDEGPLLRALLLRLGAEEYLLLLTIHHIVFDSWSATILLRELAAAYVAFSSDHPVALPALPIQYADFACWQRESLRGAVLDQSLAYWRAQLDGALALELSVRRRASVQHSQGARQVLPLSSDLFSALETMSRQARASLFMTLLASFMTLLQRYSGQTDLLIGTPSAGRDRADIEGLIGFFVNMLPIRADLAGNPRFSELLLRVREVALQAYAHQELPFEQLVEALRSARELGAHPLVQIVFALQDAPQAIALPQLSMRFVEEVATGTAKFDLTLVVEQRAPGPIAIIEYSCERFEAITITRLLRHFQTLLIAIAANPAQRLAELPLLTAAERAECLTDWNDTRSDYPQAATLHGLFAVQAVQRPDAIALVSGARHLTYAALDRRANRLAQRLQALGVGPDVPVALCMDRSVAMIVGMLGALKAGGAYLPLDPAYPSERLNFMLDDAQVRVLITASYQDKEIGRQADKQLEILLVSLSPCLSAVVECPASAATAENIAHILYTSGSTGTPKGVVIPHRAVSRLVCDTNYMQLRADDRIAHVSSVSFDAATFEIWGALAHGGQLIVIDKELALAPQRFARALRDQRITTMLLTTALFNELARQAPGAFRTIETLMFGGEAADAEQVRAVLRNGPPRRLLHMYGPTESTTYASWHEVRELPAAARSVTIGRPVANTQLYVLDRALQPVPLGVAGELYIGGAGLAHGYWQRPELTAERFVPNPFPDFGFWILDFGLRLIQNPKSKIQNGMRLYKTGDLVCYQDDGALEYLGRIDQQIKLRGFRIELGEIEAVLAQHRAVAQCVIVAHAAVAGPQLVAYVVQGSGIRDRGSEVETTRRAVSTPDPRSLIPELRTFLKERLPSYMVPAAFVFLDAFPLTPNGKLDRAALPAPDRLQHDESMIAPRTPVETALAALWAELLDLAQVSIDDNFFDHGGHSLLGTQLLSRLHQLFQVELPLRSLFEAPTIAALATLIVKQQAAQADSQTLDAMLAQLEDMSEEEVDALLAAGWSPDQVD